MKQAYVNGVPIPREAVQFELDRLVKFYASHGVGADEIKSNLEKLLERAQEQAIGFKLLLDRAAQLEIPVSDAEVDAQVEKIVKEIGGRESFEKALAAQNMDEDHLRKDLERSCRVDRLIAQACTGVEEPTEEDVAAYYEAHRESFAKDGGKTIVDVADNIRDLLRHTLRGRAIDAFVAELRSSAKVEYK